MFNWEAMRMVNEKNLERRKWEKGIQGETNQVFEGTLSMHLGTGQ